MEGISLTLSVISTCIDLAKSIDCLIQKFKDARSELHEGLRTVSSTRRLLSQFHDMFETSHLPQELVDDYINDICPLQSELENIQRFLNSYLRSSGRKGLAGLPWKYRWGKDIDRHQRNLIQLNRHLNSTLSALSLKVGFLALESIHVGYSAPAVELPPAIEIEETLSAIGRQYAEAMQDFQDKEWFNEPVTEIQQRYCAAAKAFQAEEWSSYSGNRVCG